MGSLNISQLIMPLVQPQAYARNGQVVPAVAPAMLARAANQVARWRTKELFVYGGVGNTAASAGTSPVVVARSYIHTGPFMELIRCHFLMAKPTSGTAGTPSCTVELKTTGGVSVDTATIYYSYGTGTDTLDQFSEYTAYLDGASADTDYLVEVSVDDNARLRSLLMFEEAKKPSTANGYFDDNFANTSPIYDNFRAGLATGLSSLWRRAGAVVLDWHGSFAGSTATDTNIVDGSSTGVSTSTPGFTLDMRYKCRLKDATTGVTCKLAVYAFTDGGAGGALKLKDSGGATLATVTGFGTTGSWQIATVTLPAAKAKYDLLAQNNGGATTHFTDVAIYEYAT